jgi:hypothetical protein
MSFSISEKHKQNPHHPHLTKVVFMRTARLLAAGKFHLLLETAILIHTVFAETAVGIIGNL